MIGDKINIKEIHLLPGKGILKELVTVINKNSSSTCIGLGGESGSGKSTQALALQHLLQSKGYKVIVLHMDDYFKLPPKSNHEQRLKEISNVGLQEVRLSLLENHIKTIKSGRHKSLTKPLINYHENQILGETVNIEDIDVIIVEGTYVLSLQTVDVKIFLPRTYIETKAARDERDRDEISEFNEGVLAIEHKIIAKYQSIADYILPESIESEKYIK